MNVGSEIRMQTANQRERGVRDTSTEAVRSKLYTLIRLKEIESRWKQYIQILIAPTETRFLYNLANKESLTLYEILYIFSYCDYKSTGFLTICISHKRNTAELGNFEVNFMKLIREYMFWCNNDFNVTRRWRKVRYMVYISFIYACSFTLLPRRHNKHQNSGRLRDELGAIKSAGNRIS